jgi:hypothetical protein
MGIKNVEFDADFEFLQMLQKSTSEKVMLITLFEEMFCNFFNGFESASNSFFPFCYCVQNPNALSGNLKNILFLT